MTEQGGQRRGRSRGLNRVQIIGNLGRDPEMRFTQGGTPFTTFSVAVNENWQTRDGEQQEHTEWFRVIAWARLAEIANEYLRQGQRVYVEGSLRSSEWQDREGNTRTSADLRARDLMMLSWRDEGGQRSDYGGQQAGDQYGGASAGQDAARPAASDDEISPDDLPF